MSVPSNRDHHYRNLRDRYELRIMEKWWFLQLYIQLIIYLTKFSLYLKFIYVREEYCKEIYFVSFFCYNLTCQKLLRMIWSYTNHIQLRSIYFLSAGPSNLLVIYNFLSSIYTFSPPLFYIHQSCIWNRSVFQTWSFLQFS